MSRPTRRLGLHPPAPLEPAADPETRERQAAILEYEQTYGCRLVVYAGVITPESVPGFAACLFDVVGDQDLHLLLWSPGGDGEVAVRLARMAQAATGDRDVVVLVPDVAKSAATILALGADRIVMSDTSDLGPVDPQIWWSGQFVSAKDLVDGVERATRDVEERPNTAGLYAQMLTGLDVVTLEYAHSSLDRMEDLTRQVLRSSRHRGDEVAEDLLVALRRSLVDEPDSHTAVIGAEEAADIGLPVQRLAHTDPHWRTLWSLWTYYLGLGSPHQLVVQESATTSVVVVPEPPAEDVPVAPA